MHPVDTRQVGIAAGFAALSAADVLDAGGSAEEAAAAARARADATTSLFYVDTLEYLRRGGRIGAAAALLGGALAVKPLLTIDEGRVATLEKVRTANRALSRLEELAVAAAGDRPVDVGVAHLAAGERAGQLAERLDGAAGGRARGPRDPLRRGRRGARCPRRAGHARRLRRAPRRLTRPRRLDRSRSLSTGRPWHGALHSGCAFARPRVAAAS